jgi:hypothetical protein
MEIDYSKMEEMLDISPMGDYSGFVREDLIEFALMVAKNAIFEIVHESTLQSNREVQDFTVRAVDRIKNKFGMV